MSVSLYNEPYRIESWQYIGNIYAWYFWSLASEPVRLSMLHVTYNIIYRLKVTRTNITQGVI